MNMFFALRKLFLEKMTERLKKVRLEGASACLAV